MSDDPYTAPRTDLDVEPQEAGSHPIELASRFKRLVARTIDNILVAVIAFIVLLPIAPLLLQFDQSFLEELARQTPEDEEQNVFFYLTGLYFQYTYSTQQLIGAAVGLVIYFVIQGRLLYLYGQTCGKWLLRIKIVMKDTNAKPDLSTSFAIREIGLTILGFIPIINIINLLIIFGSRRRCLHDHIAKTKVIRAYGVR